MHPIIRLTNYFTALIL